MDKQQQEKIKALEQELQALHNEMTDYRHRVQQLQADLNKLKNEAKPENSQPAYGETLPPEMPGVSFSLENFIGLRLIHIAGIIVLVTGIAIGVRYAVNRQLISEELRLLLAATAGIVLYLISSRLKNKYALFSAILFSGAMASLYFTCYAAHVFYSFIPFAAAFALMLALTLFTAYHAIRYDRQEIAVLGMTGAYAIPFLISAQQERIELFFLYMLVINLGILLLSFRKKWIFMSRLAMLVTWLVFIGWYVFNPGEDHLATGKLFMILYFLLFLVDALAYRILHSLPLQAARNWQLLSNNMALLMSLFLLYSNENNRMGPAEVMAVFLFLSGLMLVAAARVLPREKKLLRMLAIQSTGALLFFIALQWEGLSVTLLWLGTAAGLFVLGVYSRESWLRMLAIGVVTLALVKLIVADGLSFSAGEKVIAYVSIGSFLLLFSFFYQRLRNK